MSDENLTMGTSSDPATIQTPKKVETVVQQVESAFESLRDWLVKLLGDHHGVHSTIDDAKKAIMAHTPVEQATTAASTQPVTTTANTPENE
jgi:hypothetical protein